MGFPFGIRGSASNAQDASGSIIGRAARRADVDLHVVCRISIMMCSKPSCSGLFGCAIAQ